ncbi:uncharacterized protein LOC128709390 [Anopheles marshallii]|uniref:uncharacterized protein LOC128709390 n=1 Tax=Anopheles marshallii TaxID=1521116 RepID=UPI00237B8F3E|nr:uncharacterized protein LOC128709390 [Anopheles marshallii]
MPYILVETIDPAGDKELLAVPATWVQRHDNGSAYLCWPSVRSIRKLNALFQDEYSIPTEVWERYECEVLCRNIQSLTSADKMIETMEMQYDSDEIEPNKPTPDLENSTAQHRAQSKQHHQWTKSETNRQKGKVQKLLARINTQENDPLGDAKPCPQLLSLMYDLKSLIQSNQVEIRQKLKKGFGQVEKSLLAKQIESNAMQYAMERMESNALGNVSSFPPVPQFKVNLLTEMDELENFEKQLNDKEYQKKVHCWIDTTLGLERDPEHRMHTILDLIISRKLFAGFSWTGAGKEKRPMYVHKNILGLFEYAGTTPMHRANHITVELFMRKKLHNSATRVKVLGVRKSVPHRRRRTEARQSKAFQAAEAASYETSSVRSQDMASSTITQAFELEAQEDEVKLEQSSSSSSSSSSVF